jgi:hypothetical protein
LPFAALAIVPAVIVGILVYVLVGGSSGGGSSSAAGIVDGFLRLSPDANTQVESYKGEMPPDFPAEFPLYGDADPVVSFEIVTPDGTNYFSVLTTSDSADAVFEFFREALDDEPWQVEIGQSSTDVVGIQFTRPDNADVSGVITIHHSDIDDQTSIFVSYEDISAVLTPGTGGANFDAASSRPVPPGFPEEVPIYGDDEAVILDTYFQRGQGGQVFAVTFLTRDSSDDVIEFYTNEFKDRGWTATDSTTADTSFALSLEFSDQEQTISGELTADSFEEDADFTRVELVVQVSGAGANRGN